MLATNACLSLHARLATLGGQLRTLKAQIREFDRRIMAWHRSNETSRRLDEISWHWVRRSPPLWVGLVPKQHSSGGKDKLGSISKHVTPARGWRVDVRQIGRLHEVCSDPKLDILSVGAPSSATSVMRYAALAVWSLAQEV